ncbi:hypothetical protein IWZ01DRAFT_500652 [Phyllosticta capitalensis]
MFWFDSGVQVQGCRFLFSLLLIVLWFVCNCKIGSSLPDSNGLLHSTRCIASQCRSLGFGLVSVCSYRLVGFFFCSCYCGMLESSAKNRSVLDSWDLNQSIAPNSASQFAAATLLIPINDEWCPREKTSPAEIHLPKRNADGTASLEDLQQQKPNIHHDPNITFTSTTNTKPDLRTSPQTRNTGAPDCLPTTHLLLVQCISKQASKLRLQRRSGCVSSGAKNPAFSEFSSLATGVC